jgi:hypothetical protein
MKALQRIAKKGYLKPLEMLGKPVADSNLPSTGGSFYPHDISNTYRKGPRCRATSRRY